MDWNKYREDFLIKAKNQKKDKKYCDKWLSYAHNLYEQELPIIYNQEHFCKLVGYMPEYVYAASNSADHFYRTFFIPKKSGGLRKICEPLPNLKEIQKWILETILSKMQVSVYAKAYIKGKNVKENARFHRAQKKVLSLDIQDFFSKISPFLVYETFINVGYNKDVSMMITMLCCKEGGLPQGAPTSALLSNIIMKNFDNVIGDYIIKNKIRYTRYADDMTFSGEFDELEIIRLVRHELKKYGFFLNGKKTRLRKEGQRQEVTGIIVNKKLQISKDQRKKIRQEIYFIKKYGLQSHLTYTNEQRKGYIEHLFGKISYALYINPKDEELKEYREFLLQYKSNSEISLN